MPSTGDLRQIPCGELPRESVVQQTHLLGRLEEAVRQHERARAEKISLEEKLKAKTEKCEKLKAKFQALQSETQKLVTKEAAEAKSKIAARESEIEKLKERVKEVEKLITEQDMQVKRGRNSVVLRTKDMFGRIAQESRATAWEKAREEMSKREREYKVTKDLRIRELEAERKQLQTSDTSIANPPDMLTSYNSNYLWEGFGGKYCNGEIWKKLGSELGFTSKEMDEAYKQSFEGCDDNINQQNVSFDDRDIDITILLETWIKWYPGDSRGTKTFATYSGLRAALVKVGLGEQARDLRLYDEIKEMARRENEGSERQEIELWKRVMGNEQKEREQRKREWLEKEEWKKERREREELETQTGYSTIKRKRN